MSRSLVICHQLGGQTERNSSRLLSANASKPDWADQRLQPGRLDAALLKTMYEAASLGCGPNQAQPGEIVPPQHFETDIFIQLMAVRHHDENASERGFRDYIQRVTCSHGPDIRG